MAELDDNSWHLDKKVPITLIGAILVQTFGFGVYAENLNNRIANLEHDTPSAHAEFVKLEEARESTNRALDALTFQTKAVDKTLEGHERHFADLAAALERVEDTLRGNPHKN